MDRNKSLETSLVLTTGFLLTYLITQNELFLYLAFAFGIIGIFFKLLAKYIALAWFKLADILNYFVSKIILGAVFFVVLWPVSMLSKITDKDRLNLKKSEKSNWIERNHTYLPADFKNIW